METSSEIDAFDRGIRSVMQLVLPETAEALIGFRPDPELQERIDELAERSTEGQLTQAEKSEYAGYVRANKFIAILQRQAQRLIADHTPRKMEASIRAEVRERAGNACEYCRLPQDDSPLAVLHIEHIIPKIHGGSDNLDNLALACIDCNLPQRHKPDRDRSANKRGHPTLSSPT